MDLKQAEPLMMMKNQTLKDYWVYKSLMIGIKMKMEQLKSLKYVFQRMIEYFCPYLAVFTHDCGAICRVQITD